MSKIDYSEGNRPPLAKISADKIVGAAPLKVKFSGNESFDYDKTDQLTYEWYFNMDGILSSNEPNLVFTYSKPEIYKVLLRVTDVSGGKGETEIEVKVGNEEPKIEVSFDGNPSFYWNKSSVNYHVRVFDKEDGSTEDGKINLRKSQFFMIFLHRVMTLLQFPKGINKQVHY